MAEVVAEGSPEGWGEEEPLLLDEDFEMTASLSEDQFNILEK